MHPRTPKPNEVDLIAPEFIINEGFKMILCIPSASAKGIHDAAHDSAHDTAHDKKYIYIILPSRLLLIIQGEMSRTDMMQKLPPEKLPKFMKTYSMIALII